jgi:hypothetical protein
MYYYSSDKEDDEFISEDQKRAMRNAKMKAGKGIKGKTHPMCTRNDDVSRAGSLRPAGGSGQKDARVASSHPSKT